MAVSLNLFAGTLAHLSPQPSLDLSSAYSGASLAPSGFAASFNQLPHRSLPMETPASALGYFEGVPLRLSESLSAGPQGATATLNVGGPDIGLHLSDGPPRDITQLTAALQRLFANQESPGEPRVQGKIAEDIRKNLLFVRSQLTDHGMENLKVAVFAGIDLTLHRLVIRDGEKEVTSWGEVPPASVAEVVEAVWSLRGGPKRVGVRRMAQEQEPSKQANADSSISQLAQLILQKARSQAAECVVSHVERMREEYLANPQANPTERVQRIKDILKLSDEHGLLKVNVGGLKAVHEKLVLKKMNRAERRQLTVALEQYLRDELVIAQAAVSSAQTEKKPAAAEANNTEPLPAQPPVETALPADIAVSELEPNPVTKVIAPEPSNAVMTSEAAKPQEAVGVTLMDWAIKRFIKLITEDDSRAEIHSLINETNAALRAPDLSGESRNEAAELFQKILRLAMPDIGRRVLTNDELSSLLMELKAAFSDGRFNGVVKNLRTKKTELKERDTERIPQPPPVPEIETQSADIIELPGNVVDLIRLTGVVGLSAEAVFRYLQARPTQKYLMIPPTIREFEEVRACLNDIVQPEAAVQLARESMGLIDAALNQQASSLPALEGTAAITYGYLSPTAQEGFYLSSLQLDSMEPLIRFLNHPSLEVQEINAVLSLMAMLHDRGVRGYEKIVRDMSGSENYVIRGFYNELAVAMAYAQSEAVKRITMAREFSVQRASLTPEEAKAFPPGQESVVVDLVCEMENRQRLIEVKSSISQKMNYDPSTMAYCEDQARRLASVVRLQKMEGLEYFIHARDVDSKVLDALERALKAAGVAYAISVHHEEREGILVRSSPGFLPLPVNRIIPSERLRPLPPNPGPKAEKPKSTPPAPKIKSEPPQEERDQAWNKEIVDFLNRFILERPMKLTRNAKRVDALKSLKNNFRSVAQSKTYDALEDWLKQSDLDSELRNKIVKRLATLRAGITESISNHKFSILVEIASIATGLVPSEAEKGVSISLDQIRKSSRAIMHWFDSAVDDLNHRRDLLGDEGLTHEARHSFAQEEIDYGPDTTIADLPFELTANSLVALLPPNNGDRTLNAVRDHWRQYDAAYQEFLKSKESL